MHESVCACVITCYVFTNTRHTVPVGGAYAAVWLSDNTFRWASGIHLVAWAHTLCSQIAVDSRHHEHTTPKSIPVQTNGCGIHKFYRHCRSGANHVYTYCVRSLPFGCLPSTNFFCLSFPLAFILLLLRRFLFLWALPFFLFHEFHRIIVSHVMDPIYGAID